MRIKWFGLGLSLDWINLVTSYRAELLAIAVAVGSFAKVIVFCDNAAVVRIVESLLRLPSQQRLVNLPEDHRDLWTYFVQVSQHQSWGHVVRWVNAHQDLASLEGHQRTLALFNSYADREARTAVKSFASQGGYNELFARVQRTNELAVHLADFHVGLADLFCAERQVVVTTPDSGLFNVVGRGSVLDDPEVSLWLHEGFTRRLVECVPPPLVP